MTTTLPKASILDTLAVATEVFIPTVAKGVIIRRPKVVAMAERLQLDSKAVRCLQRLRAKYGAGPLLLRLPRRHQVVVLSPEHVKRVLDDTPQPFATASTEKQAALGHFEPHGVLISTGAERAERRRINEQALETDCPRHRFTERFASIVREETSDLLEQSHRALTWPAFTESWFRIVRRVTLGDGARDDTALTNMLARLRGDANWGFLHPRRRRLRERFLTRLSTYVASAEPDSLASIIARMPAAPGADPIGQMPQWLFAFDAAGIATFRALALLSAYPAEAERAQEEIQFADEVTRSTLPFLRACVLESVRLWPTTPMILRQTTRPTSWDAGEIPENTGVLIFVPFFHRDETRLPFAHRFTPDLWLTENAADGWPLIPFSAGPAVCPGQQIVLLLTSLLLATLLRDRELRLVPPGKLNEHQPLPGTLNNFSLRFTVHDRAAAARRSSPSAA
jgi:cytochrome P450